jgi:16S rRNA pseudouridine516 synthase
VPPLKLVKYLANLGYGTRRSVTAMVDAGRVRHRDGRRLRDGDSVEHDDVLADGEPLDPPPGIVLMLHKPVDYVCSTSDANPLVYDLLPSRFRERTPIVAPVGRLDRDTSGLLLLTDDGQLNHRITAPKARLPKVYEATLAHDLRGDEAVLFASGTLLLDGERIPLEPAALEVVGPRRARLTLTEGRYHQARRMFAAAGNHVESLHRHSVGGLSLGALPVGEWRVLGEEEVGRIFGE